MCFFMSMSIDDAQFRDTEAVHGVTIDVLQTTYGNELVESAMTDTPTGKSLAFKRSSMCI